MNNHQQPDILTPAFTPRGRFVTLLGCCAFAVAQPLYVRLSTQTPFLLDTGTSPLRLIILTAAIFLGLPLALWIAEWLAGCRSARLQMQTHRTLVAILFAFLSLLVGRQLFDHILIQSQGLYGLLTVVSAIAVFGVALRVLGDRRLHGAMNLAALGSLIFPCWFLCNGAAATILTPETPPEPVAVGRPAPVIMLIFDEFCGLSLLNENMEIDAARYPSFARLASMSTWYRNSTTVHARTNFAVPSLLTGCRPLDDREMTLAEAPQNLFSLLKSAGYRTAAFEPVSRLCPEDSREQKANVPFGDWAATMHRSLVPVYLHAVTPSDLSLPLPKIPNMWNGIDPSRERNEHKRRAGVFRDAGDVDAQFEHFLNCLPQSSSEPALCVLHAMSPHCPWIYLPSGEKYLASENQDPLPHPAGAGYLGEEWLPEPNLVQQAWQRYLLQVGDTDRRLGVVLSRLEESGLLNEALIVVAGDHGVSFRPGHSRRVPDGETLADILSVPLFIKLPGQTTGAISDRNVESVDVFPTIAAALEVELALPVDGDCLTDDSIPARPRKLLQFPGGSTVVSAAFTEKREALDQMLAVFGSGTGQDRLWRSLGPYPELIGAKVTHVKAFPPNGAEVRVTQGRQSRMIDDDATTQYLEGALDNRPEVGAIPLAIVADGRIIGTAQTATDPQIRGAWCCLMTELSHVPDPDEIQVFIVHPSEDGIGLEPCKLIPDHPSDS